MHENHPDTPGNSPVYVPPEGPPRGVAPSDRIFEQMGEEAIFRMCADFYTLLEQSEIRDMFPEDMPAASERLACFLVGLLGGPPLYLQRHGSPRMRQRHLQVAIDESARLTWFRCFKQVLLGAEITYGFPPEHLPGFIHFLDVFSKWMVNRAPGEHA